ncbi:MAG: zinc-binding dehydrogenase, partial [Anaerolineae bacterium]|nr:zinc-binding dehydrogenase [Anaerolineae bacterium]
MKISRLYHTHDIRLEETPLPQPDEGEVLVRLAAMSICGSDIHWFAEGGIGTYTLKQALVLGHELSGLIDSGPRKGERVAIDPAIPCGHCEFCEEGNPNFCTSLKFAGDGLTNGGLSEWITWPERCLFTLPDSISFAEGAMLEALGVGIHAIDLGHLRPAMSVGIFGCGPIGLLMIQLARLSGAGLIVATDKLPQRLEAARKMGADLVIPADKGKEVEAIMQATHKRGLDVTFEAAGENDAVEAALTAAKPGARVVLVGIPSDDKVSFKASTVRRKGLTIKMVRRMKLVYPRAIQLVQSGKIDVKSLITDRFPFELTQKAFETA